MGIYDELARQMSDEQLVDFTGRKRPYKKYKPQFSHTTTKKTMGEQYIEAIEQEGDVEEVTKKFLNKMTRQAGATKEKSAEYLQRELERAQSEGRL